MATGAAFVVSAPYIPEHDGEIELAVGDKLSDLKDLGNGWALGKNLTTNCLGIFPKNHVSVLADRVVPSYHYQPEDIAGVDNDIDYNQTEVKTPLHSLDNSVQLDSSSHTPKKRSSSPHKSASRDSLASLSRRSSRTGGRSERENTPLTPTRQSPANRRRSIPKPLPDFYSNTLPHNIRLHPQNNNDAKVCDNDVLQVQVCEPLPAPPQPVAIVGAEVPPLVPISAEKPQVAVKPNTNRAIYNQGVEPNVDITEQDLDSFPASASQVNLREYNQQPAYRNSRTAPITCQDTPLSQRIRGVGAPRGYIALNESRLPLYVDIDSASISDLQNNTNIYRESPNGPLPRGSLKRDEYRDYRSLKIPQRDEVVNYACSSRAQRNSMTRQRNTARDRNDGLKTVMALIFSLVLGGLLFVWMYYELNYGLAPSAVVAGVAAIIMCSAFALSLHCRCIAALMIPSLFTKLGRLAYLCVISGLLLTGPVMNIYRNAREVAGSMSCSAQLTYNQTKLIYSIMYRPYEAILDGLNDTVIRLQMAANNVTEELKPLEGGLNSAQKGVNKGHEALYNTTETCRRTMIRAYNECSAGITSAHGRCMDVMDALGNVYHHARSVLDRINPQNWQEDEGGQPQGRRRKRQTNNNVNLLKKNDGTPAPPSKDVCHPLDISSVCFKLNTTKESACRPAGYAGHAIQTAINTTNHALVNFKQLFGFGVDLQGYLIQQEQLQSHLHDITLKVEQEFNTRLNNFALIIDIMKKVLSFGLLLLVFQAYRYLKLFLSKDNFDNVYVTRKFKVLDKKRMEVSGDTLLPLKKQEVNNLVDVTMCGLSPCERDLYRKGLIFVMVHFIIAIICILFDTLLFWIMDMIRKHGAVDPPYSTSPENPIDVQGSSSVAEFIRLFLNGFQAQQLLGMTDRKECLPEPHRLSSILLLILGALYFIAFLLVILQAYGLRLRHKVIAYYYPNREKARIVYLYNSLLYRRSIMYHYLRNRIKSKFKEEQVLRHISCLHCLASKLPCLRIFTKWRGKLHCWGCDGLEDETFHHCMTDHCPGLYCEECYDIIEHMCPLCQENADLFDGMEEFEGSELKPFSITNSNRIYV